MCHYQILLWSPMNVGVLPLEATEWAWKMQDVVIMPIMTDMDVAPESLVKVILCKCKVCDDLD